MKHDMMQNVMTAGSFVLFWPCAYALSSRVRPIGMGVFTLAYYFVLYRKMALGMTNCMF